jgi:hypothetical protein
MKRFYQEEWHDIPFSSFSSMSSTKLADQDFYDAFYIALFNKYAKYSALNQDWRRNKDEITDWLSATIPDNSRILSIGCGLGYMEQRMWIHEGPRIELHVQDYSSQALKWLRKVLPANRIHDVGECDIGYFDLIYISAVDYAMPDDDLIGLLKLAISKLSAGGELVIISASFLDESSGWKIFKKYKDGLIWLLDKISLRQRGQFWGWTRSRKDYQTIMCKAGLTSLTDGFLETPHQRTYWIRAYRLSI